MSDSTLARPERPSPLARLGRAAQQAVGAFGALGRHGGALLRCSLTPPGRGALLARELHKVGVLSLIIVTVSGLAVGAVLALQGYNTLVRFGATGQLGAVVALALIRELGPVLTALLVTGRAGSATTAEIATMVATEQLDGIRMMAVDPLHYVAKPRALALLAVMPLLTALFIVAGLLGGWLVGVELMGIDAGLYINSITSNVEFGSDVLGCFVKSLVFGTLLALIATWRGCTSAPTSEGVSAATTATVVSASVAVLIFDYFITALWGV